MSKDLAKSARKRFGQNFLIDGRVIDAILASINASASDAVVEIGPGHGAITEGLYASQCDLTLIELDRDLVPGLLASFVSKSPATAQDFRGPFGGFKDSGFGRNLGYEGVVQFQGHHSISSVPGWLF